jgi:hypothetical protein
VRDRLTFGIAVLRSGPGHVSATADTGATGEYYCPSCEQAYFIAGACPRDRTKLIRIGGGIDPLLGRNLDDKYTLLEKLGQGGMGAVYRAEQRGLGREVAVKVVDPQRASSPEMIKRFLREAKLASRLGHPNAVGVIDFGQTDDGLCYLVMELVTGRTLEAVFTAEGVFPPARLVRIATQLCDALECAHALQIVHRDLKPSNAMVLDQGRDFVKILDFGLAKSVASVGVTAVTISGTVLGTPAYMSPEHARGQPCDGRADLYSLGVMLYLLGSGRLPFQSNSPHELMAMHDSEPAPPMAGVPRALAQVIGRLLRKDPAERYPTAAAVREALEGALATGDAAIVDEPIRDAGTGVGPAEAALPGPRPVTLPPRGHRTLQVRRRRRWVAPTVVASLVAAGLSALLVFAGNSTRPMARSVAPPPVDAGTVATPPPPDAGSAGAPAATSPADATPRRTSTGTATPARPAKPGRPTLPRPRPARPADPKPVDARSKTRDELPF